jgi:hypothetical protein
MKTGRENKMESKHALSVPANTRVTVQHRYIDVRGNSRQKTTVNRGVANGGGPGPGDTI